MYLETKRLILRTPEPRDVADYMEFCNSEFVLHYNAMTPKTEAEVLAQFEDSGPDWKTIAIARKDTGKVIGMVFTEEDSLRWGVASRELSYFLREEEARKGYMKEALHTVIGHLFETENLTCVAARCFAPNTASRRLLESLGFRCDGVVRQCVKGYGDVIYDDALYSLMREEFE